MSTQTTTPLQQLITYITSNKKRASILMAILAVAILGASGWAWWTKVYTSPHKVFWDTIDQSLATNSYSKTIDSETPSQKLNQQVHLQFNGNLRAVTTTNLKQSTNNVITETIGTPKGGYARYKYIDSKPATSDKSVKKRDYSKIVGVWSKLEPTANGGSNTSMIDEAMFGPVLFGNLNYTQRHKLVTDMRNHKAYVVDYSKLKKQTKGGHMLYTYHVSLAPKSFITTVADFFNAAGLDGSQFDLNQYSDEKKVAMEITIDVVSRRVDNVKYLDGSGREEKYGNFGVTKQIALPQKTIKTTELQQRLQKIEQ